MECYETVQAVVDSQLRNGGNQKHYDKLQNVGAGRHQSIKRKEQNNANSESKYRWELSHM